MTKIFFVGNHGADDPAKDTFLPMQAKSAIEVVHETGIILMLEATPVIKDHIAAQV